MKKDIKAWAIKVQGRSFYQNRDGYPHLYRSRASALNGVKQVEFFDEIKAKPIRIRVRIEEVV